MDNSTFLGQFGGNDTASSIYQGLINCNGSDLDIFLDLRKEGTSKLVDSTMAQQEIYLIEKVNDSYSLDSQGKYSESFFDIETKCIGNNKKDLKNDDMSDHLQDIYDLIINDENRRTGENSKTDESNSGNSGDIPPSIRGFPEEGASTKLKLVIKCNSCDTVVGSKRDFVVHYKKCRSDKVPAEFTCPLCDKSFGNYMSFRTHWYRHMPHKHKCPFCDKSFGLRSKLLSHVMAKHSNLRPHVCKTCNKGYALQSSLRRHEKSHTQRQHNHSCSICHKMFVSEQSMRTHVRLHKTGRCFMCEVCGERFLYKSHLACHASSIHAKNRPFVCDNCGKKFATLLHLRRHWKMHDEDRPFKCEDCPKTFKTKHCLNEHCRLHSPHRPYVCSQCNKGFVKIRKLQEHFNTHTGDRPFVCSACQRTFTNQANLIKHTRRIHNKKRVENVDDNVDNSGEVRRQQDPTLLPSPFNHQQTSVDLLAHAPDIIDDIDQNLSFLDGFNFSQEIVLID